MSDLIAPRFDYEAIKAVEAELETARQRVRDLEARRHRSLTEPWGIAVGDTVRLTTRAQSGKLARVAHVRDASLGYRPYLYVYIQKKDGTFSDRAVDAYNLWERVEPALTGGPTP